MKYRNWIFLALQHSFKSRKEKRSSFSKYTSSKFRLKFLFLKHSSRGEHFTRLIGYSLFPSVSVCVVSMVWRKCECLFIAMLPEMILENGAVLSGTADCPDYLWDPSTWIADTHVESRILQCVSTLTSVACSKRFIWRKLVALFARGEVSVSKNMRSRTSPTTPACLDSFDNTALRNVMRNFFRWHECLRLANVFGVKTFNFVACISLLNTKPPYAVFPCPVPVRTEILNSRLTRDRQHHTRRYEVSLYDDKRSWEVGSHWQ